MIEASESALVFNRRDTRCAGAALMQTDLCLETIDSRRDDREMRSLDALGSVLTRRQRPSSHVRVL
jgi:hypothetical protein